MSIFKSNSQTLIGCFYSIRKVRRHIDDNSLLYVSTQQQSTSSVNEIYVFFNVSVLYWMQHAKCKKRSLVHDYLHRLKTSEWMSFFIAFTGIDADILFLLLCGISPNVTSALSGCTIKLRLSTFLRQSRDADESDAAIASFTRKTFGVEEYFYTKVWLIDTKKNNSVRSPKW